MDAPREIRLNLSFTEEAMNNLRDLARADHRTVGNYAWAVLMAHISKSKPLLPISEDAQSDVS